MAGAQLEQLPSFFSQYNFKCLLIFVEIEKYSHFLVTNEYAVSTHTSDFCKYDRSMFHILLYGANTEQIIDQLKDYYYKYQEVDATYAYFKYYIANGDGIAIKGDLMEKLAKAVKYNRTHPTFEVRPSILKKRLFRKKRKIHRPQHNSRSFGTQTAESNLSKRVEMIMKSKLALDFLRIIDCMLDNNGCVDSNKVHFHMK